jgi:hypothetical protein
MIPTPIPHVNEPSPPSPLRALPASLAALAGLASDDGDLQSVLQHAGDTCRRALGEVEVGITLGSPGDPDAVSATSRIARELDDAQRTANAGPVPMAFQTRAVVSSADLGGDDRWPALADVLGTGRMQVVAVPVETGRRVVGVLSVYSVQEPQEPRTTETAVLLAATLGAVFLELERNAELERLHVDMQRALSSRAVIEQAKGIIMAQRGCGPDEAFAHLTELSSRQERKLRDVARDIVEQVSRG